MAWNFQPYVAPQLTQNQNGGVSYEGATTPWVDTASQVQGNPDAYQGRMTRDAMRYHSGLGLNYMNQGFNGLGQSMGEMGQKLTDNMQEISGYGGLFGNQQGGVYSPQSKNGYGSGLGQNNPWKTGSF